MADTLTEAHIEMLSRLHIADSMFGRGFTSISNEQDVILEELFAFGLVNKEVQESDLDSIDESTISNLDRLLLLLARMFSRGRKQIEVYSINERGRRLLQEEDHLLTKEQIDTAFDKALGIIARTFGSLDNTP